MACFGTADLPGCFLVCNRFGDSKSKPEIGKPEDEKVDYSLKAQLDEALSSQMSLMAYGGKKRFRRSFTISWFAAMRQKTGRTMFVKRRAASAVFPVKNGLVVW